MSPIRTPSSLQRYFAASREAFVAYARWLDSLSWKRFFLIAILAFIATGILSELPPFSLRWGEDRTEPKPASRHASTDRSFPKGNIKITIDGSGVRIAPVRRPASSPSAPAASDAADLPDSHADIPDIPEPPTPPTPPAPPGTSAIPGIPDAGVTIKLPKNADTDEIKKAIEEAQDAIEEALHEAQPKTQVVRAFRLGDHIPGFMAAWILLSIVIKLMAAGRFRAEAQAVVATEKAESEALKRQVVEARMAAMQAQVEPHFLFNTLASIDHLIETDPPRASKMQKNLIALLRASMPTMREANAQGTRDLGRELAVIRPYLEILKVRMEERLQTEVRVSDGLLSAEFPPMMLQGLVENAIKHGLEPKADGGRLTVSAEIVHGKLAVTVADTGLGFGKAATAGTGIGLNNIRERLQLLYGTRASLVVADTPGGGTTVTITVPYVTLHGTERGA